MGDRQQTRDGDRVGVVRGWVAGKPKGAGRTASLVIKIAIHKFLFAIIKYSHLEWYEILHCYAIMILCYCYNFYFHTFVIFVVCVL